jgi:hypothetical protein
VLQSLLHGLEERLAALQTENSELNRTLQGALLPFGAKITIYHFPRFWLPRDA